jgi:hypothetical protein
MIGVYINNLYELISSFSLLPFQFLPPMGQAGDHVPKICAYA